MAWQAEPGDEQEGSEARGLRGHKTLNLERMQDRRRQILVAAAVVFARKGYSSASVQDVAEELRASKGVIYYQFPSKEHLFVELRLTMAENAIRSLTEISAMDVPVPQRLRLAVERIVEDEFTEPNRSAGLVLDIPEELSSEGARAIRRSYRQYREKLTKLYQLGVEDGTLVDRNPLIVVSAIIWSTMTVRRWYRAGGTLSESAIAEEIADLLLDGLEVQPAVRPRSGRRGKR